MTRKPLIVTMVSVFLLMLALPALSSGNYLPDRSADLEHIRAELWFDFPNKTVSGTAQLTFSAFSDPFSHLVIQAEDMTLLQVTDMDGNDLDYRYDGSTLEVEFSKPRSEFIINIRYKVTPETGLYFRLANKNQPDRPTHLFTQGESQDNHFWLPLVDAPNEMLTTDFFLHVNPDYAALGNGRLVNKSTDDAGLTLWHYAMEKPHAAYLIALVIGDLESYQEEWQGIPLEYYVVRGDLDKAKQTYRYTRDMMDFFSNITGVKYPWSRYAQATVSEYMYGGMENTTLTVLTDSTLRSERAMLDGNSDGLIAHELSHQWFGDLVTCRDWPNAWLNEGFASYYTSQWTQFKEGWDPYVFDMQGSLYSYLRNDRRYRRSIVSYKTEDEHRLFDSHAYNKGGFVLHMLRYKLGNPAYHAAINHYLTENAHKNVDTYDLIRAIEESSGQYVQSFFNQWVFASGHPELQVRHEYKQDEGVLLVHVGQTQKLGDGTPLFDFPLDVSWETSQGNFQETLRIDDVEQTLTIKTGEKPLQVSLDPHGLLLGTFEHDRSREELIRSAEYGASSLVRYRAIEDLAPLVEETEILDLFARIMDSENFYKIKEAVMETLFESTKKEELALLLQGLKNPEPSVREISADALGTWQGETGSSSNLITALRESFAEDASERVQASALSALVTLEADDLEAFLDLALATPSHREIIRRVALDGFEQYQYPGTLKKVKPFASRGHSSWVRTRAMTAVAHIQGPTKKTARWLNPMLEENSYWIKRTAMELLAEMNEVPQALTYLEDQLGRETSKSHQRALRRAIEDHQGTAEPPESRVAARAQKDLEKAKREIQQLNQDIEDLEDILKKAAQSSQAAGGFSGDI